ncbi:ABC transporter ATP-binding protein [Paracoccus sp. Z118]|uniref:ABC transporter ATP-binding protein n=1 Tax=Paracoccus sp. Z118 TaxID=2851017 RepID=UPI001C2B86FD|nr:ABC transporter ATP-binding protein [Paracoccus sp. Z118]MBV0892086.1 ABC transporter ATP-binding protein [Paracoccus sp. Z118]
MPTGNAPILSASGLCAELGGRPVLEDIDLTLRRGEVLVVLGPSGCGKSTLLRLLGGLIAPGSGRVLLAGHPPRPGRGSATVFQNYRLLPWKSVIDNVVFALPEVPPTQARLRAAEVLGLVGLSRVSDAFPAQLSGGMRQRVALARALAPRPEVILMDEPFSAIDAQAREIMQGELLRLTRAVGGPGVVFVTHSVDEALILGTHVLLLSPRPGRILRRIAPPDWQGDPMAHPQFAPLRRQLWEELKESVLNDPNSDFHRAAL